MNKKQRLLLSVTLLLCVSAFSQSISKRQEKQIYQTAIAYFIGSFYTGDYKISLDNTIDNHIMIRTNFADPDLCKCFTWCKKNVRWSVSWCQVLGLANEQRRAMTGSKIPSLYVPVSLYTLEPKDSTAYLSNDLTTKDSIFPGDCRIALSGILKYKSKAIVAISISSPENNERSDILFLSKKNGRWNISAMWSGRNE